jgi:hypothetical protein
MRSDDLEVLGAAKREFEIMKELSHPGLIEVDSFYVHKMKNTAYLVMKQFESAISLEEFAH